MPNPVDDQEQQGAPAGFAEAALAQIAFRQERIEALLTQVETLTRERDEALQHASNLRDRLGEAGVEIMAETKACTAAEARALTAEAERDDLLTQLRAAHRALEPFAAIAGQFAAEPDGFGLIWAYTNHPDEPDLTVGHLRTARSLLHTEKTEGSAGRLALHPSKTEETGGSDG